MRKSSSLPPSALQQHPSWSFTPILLFDSFLHESAVHVTLPILVHNPTMHIIRIEYRTKPQDMSSLVYAYFDVHLEGQNIESEIICVPVQDTPHWSFGCEGVGARVAVGCYTWVAVVFGLDQDAEVCVGDAVFDYALGDCEG